MMKSSTLFLFWCLSLLEIIPRFGFGMNIRELPIRLRILEFDRQSDRLVQVLTSRHSDLVVGDGTASGNTFVLECRSFLSQMAFTYRGDGIPEYRTHANITRTRHGSTYWTFITFSRFPQAQDTGNYSCQSMTNQAESNSVYLYVPGSTQSVFVPSDSASRLQFLRSDSSIRVPCSVVHPDASVSLERIADRSTLRAKVQDRVTYNPKSGFKVPMTMVLAGSTIRFICRGEFKGRIEEVSYQLFSEESTSNTPPYNIPDTGISKSSEGLISPCKQSTCGNNAECIVIDYRAICVCFEDYTGNAKYGCHKINDNNSQLTVRNKCDPSPCGPYSNCLVVNDHPICSCLENYFGAPPKCTPYKVSFCTSSNDCEWEEYCNQETRKCDSVCKGGVNFCGENSRCLVINHTPFCECLAGYRGNPYLVKDNKGCTQPSIDRKQKVCETASCGLHAICKVHPDFPTPLCFCPNDYTGDASTVCFKIRSSPENFTATRQPELTTPRPLCGPQICGINGLCRVRNNQIQCNCPSGYRGNPWIKCSEIPKYNSALDETEVCSICGPNSICKISKNRDGNKLVKCECTPGTSGNPPNCSRIKNFCRDDLDCPDQKVCDRNKCKKPEIEEINHPCLINCGPNTVCRVVPFQELQQYRDSLRESRQDALYFDMVKANGKLRNGRFSECFCRTGYDGNPYSVAGCQPQSDPDYPMIIVMNPDPCKPKSPCGENSKCRSFNGKAFCSCDQNSTGQPPNCKLRCQSDKDCLFNETCINKICEDP